MAEFLSLFVVIFIVVIVVMLVRGLWRMFMSAGQPSGQEPAQTSVQPQTRQGLGEMTAEEEGNVHSGPYGYSPNTAYPETQYGSMFNPDAEWNHEEQ